MVQINMSIPESCAECRLSVRHFGKLYCPALDGRVGNEGKDSRCPLVDAGDHFADASKKGDLISRADALSCFHDWIDQRGDVHTADEMPEFQRIEQLPGVQPEHPMVDIAKVTMAMVKKADMVAVTRCKDCKWSGLYTSADDKRYCYCYETGKGGRTEDDYCSFAVRKDE